MKQERILIDFDKEAAEKKIKQIETAYDKLQALYKSLTEIIGGSISKEEFLSVFENYNRFGLLKISDSNLKELFVSKKAPEGKIGGIPFNTDMINLPDISHLKSINITGADTLFLSQGYLSVQDGDIIKAKGYSLRVSDEFKIFAETPEEVERYKLAKNLSDAWNAIAKTLPSDLYYETLREEHLRTVIDSDDKGVFHPAPFYIKYGRVEMQAVPVSSNIHPVPANERKESELSNSYIESLLQDSESDASSNEGNSGSIEYESYVESLLHDGE